MRIIITGGTGLLGRSLAENLLQDNHQVIILSRNPQKRANIPTGAQVEKWDARTAAGWGHLADGAKAIINLAGASIAGEGLFPSRWTAQRKKAILQSRLNAAKAVASAVEQAPNKPGVVIQSSAIGYYGTSLNATFTEDSPPGDDYLAESICQPWEAAIKPVAEMGVRLVTIRTGIVLSAEGGALPSMLLPFKFFAGGPLGSGKQWLSWIHMKDEIAAMRYLLENDSLSGPFNLTAPNPVRNAAFSKTIGKVMGRPSFMPAPAFAFKLAFGEVATVVLDGQKVLPQRLQEAGFSFQFEQAESALRDLLGK